MEGVRVNLLIRSGTAHGSGFSKPPEISRFEGGRIEGAREFLVHGTPECLRAVLGLDGEPGNNQDLLGQLLDAGTVAQMAEKNPELLTPFVERFFKERIEPNLSSGVGEVKTAGTQALEQPRQGGNLYWVYIVAEGGGEWLGQVK